MMKKTLLATAVIGTLTLAACNQNDASTPPGLFPVEGEVVATVNGIKITQPQVDEYMEYRASMNQPAADPVTELVNLEILRQAAVKEGYAKKPEVRASMTRAATNVLANPMVREAIASDVTEDELRAVYEEQVEMMQSAAGANTEYRASHILVESEEEALAIVTELDEGGDFAAIAQEKSTGPSGSNGGELGWATPDTYVEEFAEALEQLENGSYTKEPVETQFGWHVILLNETREAEASEVPGFDMVKDQLRNVVMQQRMQEYMEDLREKADVSVEGQGSADAEPAAVEDESAE
ncbi:MAG: foldase protein PrsA [Pseudomonadota bacterium]